MEAEEGHTVTAIVAVTTVTVAATGFTPPSPAKQSAVSLSGDLQQKQVNVITFSDENLVKFGFLLCKVFYISFNRFYTTITFHFYSNTRIECSH